MSEERETSTEELKIETPAEGEAPEAPPVPTPAPISDQDDLTPAEG